MKPQKEENTCGESWVASEQKKQQGKNRIKLNVDYCR